MNQLRTVRAAMTQTVNAYPDMPASRADLPGLKTKLEGLRQANVAKHVELLHQAKALGAQIICFGELFTGPYFALGERDPMWFELAEDPFTGPTVTELQGVAREASMIVIAPLYEVEEGTGRRYNTAVVIDETGEHLGCYRKTHIPQGNNEQGVFDESFYYEPSRGQRNEEPANHSRNRFFPVFQTSLGKIGVAICYDRHFPGVASSLVREGADILFCPAVTFGSKSQRMWHMEFAVDACRYRVYVGGSNRRGQEPPWNQAFFGESHFVGPDGVLEDLSTDPELIVSDLDLAQLFAPDSSGWNLRRDARPQIYTTGFGRRVLPRPLEPGEEADPDRI